MDQDLVTQNDVWRGVHHAFQPGKITELGKFAISISCCLSLESFERYLLVCVGRVLQLGLLCLPDWGEVGVCHSFLGCETFL
jgi:hypothetical protein